MGNLIICERCNHDLFMVELNGLLTCNSCGELEHMPSAIPPTAHNAAEPAVEGEPVGMVVHPASAAPTEFKLAWFVNIEQLPPNTKFYTTPQPRIPPELIAKIEALQLDPVKNWLSDDDKRCNDLIDEILEIIKEFSA